MIGPGTGARIYLACGVTDMRKSITGLAILTQDHLRQNPASGAVFAFRGRKGDRIKLLYWDGQGFLPLLQDSAAGHVPMVWQQGCRGTTDLGSVGNAMGRDRLAAAVMGRSTNASWMICLAD